MKLNTDQFTRDIQYGALLSICKHWLLYMCTSLAGVSNPL